MPTFKHPCPYCQNFIERDVVACPYCGTKDPFSPRRCVNCKAELQPEYVACPKCGTAVAPVGKPAAATAPAPAPNPAPAPAAPIPTPATAGGACPTCGSAVTAGSRFCQVCGSALG